MRVGEVGTRYYYPRNKKKYKAALAVYKEKAEAVRVALFSLCSAPDIMPDSDYEKLEQAVSEAQEARDKAFRKMLYTQVRHAKLTDWEKDFCESFEDCQCKTVSRNQRAILEGIGERWDDEIWFIYKNRFYKIFGRYLTIETIEEGEQA